jgi:hypothetical protein
MAECFWTNEGNCVEACGEPTGWAGGALLAQRWRYDFISDIGDALVCTNLFNARDLTGGSFGYQDFFGSTNGRRGSIYFSALPTQVVITHMELFGGYFCDTIGDAPPAWFPTACSEVGGRLSPLVMTPQVVDDEYCFPYVNRSREEVLIAQAANLSLAMPLRTYDYDPHGYGRYSEQAFVLPAAELKYTLGLTDDDWYETTQLFAEIQVAPGYTFYGAMGDGYCV